MTHPNYFVQNYIPSQGYGTLRFGGVLGFGTMGGFSPQLMPFTFVSDLSNRIRNWLFSANDFEFSRVELTFKDLKQRNIIVTRSRPEQANQAQSSSTPAPESTEIILEDHHFRCDPIEQTVQPKPPQSPQAGNSQLFDFLGSGSESDSAPPIRAPNPPLKSVDAFWLEVVGILMQNGAGLEFRELSKEFAQRGLRLSHDDYAALMERKKIWAKKDVLSFLQLYISIQKERIDTASNACSVSVEGQDMWIEADLYSSSESEIKAEKPIGNLLGVYCSKLPEANRIWNMYMIKNHLKREFPYNPECYSYLYNYFTTTNFFDPNLLPQGSRKYLIEEIRLGFDQRNADRLGGFLNKFFKLWIAEAISDEGIQALAAEMLGLMPTDPNDLEKQNLTSFLAILSQDKVWKDIGHSKFKNLFFYGLFEAMMKKPVDALEIHFVTLFQNIDSILYFFQIMDLLFEEKTTYGETLKKRAFNAVMQVIMANPTLKAEYEKIMKRQSEEFMGKFMYFLQHDKNASLYITGGFIVMGLATAGLMSMYNAGS